MSLPIIGAIPALDLGGTFAKGAVVDLRDASEHLARSWPTPQGASPQALVDHVTRLGQELLEATAAHYGKPAQCLGLSVPGIVDEEAGQTVFSSNLGWRNMPLRQILQERLGLSVVLSHDVTAAGLAEAVFGAGADARIVLTVVLGTGIAGALTIDGQPYRGAHHMAVEIGHLQMPGFVERCGCGGIGCLEAVASAAAIARRYAKAAPACGHQTAEQIVALAGGSDQTARQIWHSALDALGDALARSVVLLDPDVIVLAGGLAKAGQALRDPVARRMAASLTFTEPPPIKISALGDRAGVIGTAWAAYRTIQPEGEL